SESMDSVKAAISCIYEQRYELQSLIPIGCSQDSTDLFVIAYPAEGSTGCEVLWVAGTEVDRFSNFYEFFESMIACHRQLLDQIQSDPRLSRA
ncbi:MAG: hypothetical protein AAFY07_14145, partial [Pseudomonadota bacterium]